MRLYAITDRRLLPGTHEHGRLSAAERDGLAGLAAEWAALGVEFVQLREKDLGAPDLTELADAMLAAMRHSALGNRPRLLINAGAAGAAEVARRVGASGIHLPGRWRAEQVGMARIAGTVSVGCHSVGEVAVGRTTGADIALLSPVFRTESHPEAAALGLATLTAACQAGRTGAAGSMPVFALGGVNATNAASCIEAGAAGVAGIRTFLSGRWAAAEPSSAAK
jgi:thiamine-phosphate pyrophosphorylase